MQLSNKLNASASAGSDGSVPTWDHKLKKGLPQYPEYFAPIASIAFSGSAATAPVWRLV